MIIDTTYLLPLARIGVRHDLLRAIVEGRVQGVSLSKLGVSLISLFELQAKAAKLGIPPEHVARAVRAILKSFMVIPFYSTKIIETAHELRTLMSDYIDCVIVATAVVTGEDLVTEDTVIHENSEHIEKKYGIRVLSYNKLMR